MVWLTLSVSHEEDFGDPEFSKKVSSAVPANYNPPRWDAVFIEIITRLRVARRASAPKRQAHKLIWGIKGQVDFYLCKSGQLPASSRDIRPAEPQEVWAQEPVS